MNGVRLTGSLVERNALRYTPAGIPVFEARLQHQSRALEAGIERTLDFGFGVIALGIVASRMATEPPGSELEVRGFLAPRTRRSTRLLVHVQEFSRIGVSPVDEAIPVPTDEQQGVQ